MTRAARIILAGLVLVVGAVAAYGMFDWVGIFAAYPQFVRPLKVVLRPALDAAWHVALSLPVVLLLAAIYQFVVAKGGRGIILAKLFAWFTLWVIGSFAFFAGMFLAYMPDLGHGGLGLAAPALLAIIGYIVIGVGFVLSVLQK